MSSNCCTPFLEDDKTEEEQKEDKEQILEEARTSSALKGLNGLIGNVQIREIAQEILKISFEGLKRRNYVDKKGIPETQYLDPLFNIIENGKTAAEELLEKYNNIWSKNINKIFETEGF